MKQHDKARLPLAICVVLLTLAGWARPADSQADDIIEQSGIHGGIVVHLGCGNGRLTAALRVSESYTVHGLDPDVDEIREARRYIRGRGVYGQVSVEQFSGRLLPYTDNLINLVVVSDSGEVDEEEIMRVLAPGGVICTDSGGTWKRTVKPRPDAIDDWGHFLHDAGNNAVADDSVVAPPQSLQWVASPLWLRSHETPSGIQSPVSSGGRLYYFFDEGLIGITDERLPDRWSLICRDAFNGKLLWKKQLEAWGWRQWSRKRWEGKDWLKLRAGRTDVPTVNQRRIVADEDRLYTTLSYRAPMSILDGATGKIVKTIEETAETTEILVSDGIAVAYVQRSIDGGEFEGLVAVNGRDGRVLWQKQTGGIHTLMLAINNGRIIYISAGELVGLNLKDGERLWKVQAAIGGPRTMLAARDTVVMQGGRRAAAHNAATGRLLWDKKNLPPIRGGEGDDLFVVDGLVWRGMLSVDDSGKPVGKSPNAMAIGWDLRTGKEKKRIMVKNLRSPEHHHRCYRNKATTRYMISSYEGAEFLDFHADDHSQNNWIRGACKNGMVPCNGMLYVPPDQCFCQPGAKLLGYTAVKAGADKAFEIVPDNRRLTKGAAYGKVDSVGISEDDWPTFRHDAARSGTTGASVGDSVAVDWKVKLEGKLTAPVSACGRVFVAETDAHTLHALDLDTGESLWRFTANGRIDSPPTVYKGMVLVGSRDGCVYCLRLSDGELVWRFLAAPADVRVGGFGQLESAWGVHGSVLVRDEIAYFTSGRSTYLDGGIRVYGLDPRTGKIIHKGLLEGPDNFGRGDRDLAFFITGANSDVLVSEGGYLYMRQKKLTSDLKEVEVPVLSSKGAQDVGLHVFSTAGLLDGSWYNRTFWMYSRRWPGFQLANQAPKAGQLLVVDDEKTYAVRMFYRRNVHSPMFFPGTDGYLLFADYNTNEPQIVGEEGSVEPIEWLPQSDYSRARGNEVRELESRAFGLDKMIGYTRARPTVWKTWLPVRMRAMVKAADTLFVAGAPDVFDPDDPYAAFEGRKGAKLVSVSAEDGKKNFEIPLEYPPVFNGMIAARGRLLASLVDGSIICLSGK